jgi:hypothetical protein
MEAADGGGSLAGAGVWPAGELQGPDWFLFFVLDLIAFSFLFRGMIAFIFSVLRLDCFFIFYLRTYI